MSSTGTERLRALAAAASPGDRLPSVRMLMRVWRVSPVTVQRALDTLSREGVLEARPWHVRRRARGGRTGDRRLRLAEPSAGPRARHHERHGRQCASATGRCAPAPDGLSAPRAAARPPPGHRDPACAPPGVWDRSPAAGYEALRAWFAAGTSGAFQPRDVVICPGSQAAIATTFHALAQPGQPVRMESPTYYGAIAAD